MKRLALLLLLIGCGRAETVVRGATSVFRSTEPPPRHDELAHDAKLAVLFVGHATVLIQLDDRVIVTDPVVTATVGQLSKRLVAPGLAPERFPSIDVVTISHMHYDHLSLGSLLKLESKIGFLAMPKGGLAYLPELAFDATEVEAWSHIDVAGVRVTSTPARHQGWRYGFDNWAHARGGWVLERSGTTVYFAGDTGFDRELFAAVRARFPKIDLALLPIAPMEPHALIEGFHMDAKEAVDAFIALGAERMMPIHYDTFINSLDRPGEAIPALMAAAAKAKLPSSRIAVVAIGERRVIVPR